MGECSSVNFVTPYLRTDIYRVITVVASLGTMYFSKMDGNQEGESGRMCVCQRDSVFVSFVYHLFIFKASHYLPGNPLLPWLKAIT